MTDASLAWPKKTRDIHNHHMDSTIWDRFAFRDDDVIVATYAKAGTTWTQQIVGQLAFQGDPAVKVAEISPWVDLRIMPPNLLELLEAQRHRRIVKTHLPLNALTFSPKAKYVYIGRDGRDVVWSFYNHHVSANELWYDKLNNTPGRVGPPIERPDPDIRRYFLTWLENDGAPLWSFWENIATWWGARDLPNVRLIHFNDLKRDLEGEMRKLAAFLECDVPEDRWPQIVEHCSFEWMKAHAETVTPLGGALWEGGADTFIHKGVNGRWRDVLTPEDVAAYEQRAQAELGPECARWLAEGTLATREPAASAG
jgi:aryl sulfotransferase